MKRYAVLLSAVILLLSGCVKYEGSETEKQQFSAAETPAASVKEEKTETAEQNEGNLILQIGDAVFEAETADNDTARAFLELLPSELEMSELNGNEKYAYLDQELPSASANPGTIEAGDLMLYGDNCIV
ncbi:MAG: hypothetical protein IJ130_01045, partial [Solobacterium sp.]|nr:hypothetical protein [Solobacterium sp.]